MRGNLSEFSVGVGDLYRDIFRLLNIYTRRVDFVLNTEVGFKIA